MTYVDTSMVLAWVLAEDIRPADDFWRPEELVTSRLTEYEAWVRLHAYGRGEADGERLAATLAAMGVIALNESTCARCLAPFPAPVRTLDAIHLAAADHLRTRGLLPRFASYDRRQRAAARAMGFDLYPSE